MPRPRKCRRICVMPAVKSFAPQGIDAKGVVLMAVDEYETLRLVDHLGLTQEECAAQMGVARTTVQAVYGEARRKLALALVEGRRLEIGGGAYELCKDSAGCCGQSCGKHACANGECSCGCRK